MVSYRDILEIFFTIHDPTTLNRQGNDVGTQYRSVIYLPRAPQQQETAAPGDRRDGQCLGRAHRHRTQAAAETYYKAEDYHQNYFRQNPMQGYCAFVVAPKVAKFRKTFADKINRLKRAAVQHSSAVHVSARPGHAAALAPALPQTT